MIPSNILSFVLEREGVDLAHGDIGYVNNPNDPGGATAFGITQSTYDSYRNSIKQPTQSVKSIAYPAEVDAIYEQEYWKVSKCDQFVATKSNLALVHFDCAVNQGTGQAALCLQRAVGVTADGQIGPQTLNAVAACDESAAIEKYLIDRARVYKIIVQRRPTSQQFLYGWLARLRWCARATNTPIDASFAQ